MAGCRSLSNQQLPDMEQLRRGAPRACACPWNSSRTMESQSMTISRRTSHGSILVILAVFLIVAGLTSAADAQNLALNRPVVVSSAENAGTPGTSAVDGNAGTRWSSAFTD